MSVENQAILDFKKCFEGIAVNPIFDHSLKTKEGRIVVIITKEVMVTSSRLETFFKRLMEG